MKTKKLPIFLEIIKNSFFAIILILIIYTIGQLITFWIFTYEYEGDLLKDRYREVITLAQNINSQISEEGFNEYLQMLSQGENDEYVRIYSSNRVYYQSQSGIWENIEFKYLQQDIKVEFKLLDFDIYTLLTGPLEIEDSQYIVQIIRENDIFQEFTENSLPIFIFTLILGLILSGIGAMYVSKKFINS